MIVIRKLAAPVYTYQCSNCGEPLMIRDNGELLHMTEKWGGDGHGKECRCIHAGKSFELPPDILELQEINTKYKIT